MHITVNASLLDETPSGLGVYTENVLVGLSKLISSHDTATIYTSSSKNLEVQVPASVIFSRVPSLLRQRFGKRAGLARFFWNQLIFPLKLHAQEVVYCPTHHGFLWGPSKQVVTIHDLLAIKFPTQYRLQYYYFKYFLPLLLRKVAAV